MPIRSMRTSVAWSVLHSRNKPGMSTRRSEIGEGTGCFHDSRCSMALYYTRLTPQHRYTPFEAVWPFVRAEALCQPPKTAIRSSLVLRRQTSSGSPCKQDTRAAPTPRITSPTELKAENALPILFSRLVGHGSRSGFHLKPNHNPKCQQVRGSRVENGEEYVVWLGKRVSHLPFMR